MSNEATDHVALAQAAMEIGREFDTPVTIPWQLLSAVLEEAGRQGIDKSPARSLLYRLVEEGVIDSRRRPEVDRTFLVPGPASRCVGHYGRRV